MTEQLKNDRQHMVLFSLLWVAATLWGVRYYPLVKDFDFSKLSPGQLNILLLTSLVSLFALIMTAVYVYKVAKILNHPVFSAKMVTFMFVLCALLLGLFSYIIVAILLYRSSKHILKDKAPK